MVIKTAGRELTDDEKDAREFSPATQVRYGRVYWAKVKGFNAAATKPLVVERTHRGATHTIDCYVTTQVKDEYQAGTLTVGDYVIISFIDGDPEKPCAILKAHETW